MGRFQKWIKISLLAAAFIMWLLLRAVFTELWSVFKLPLTALNVGRWVKAWDAWPEFLSFVEVWRLVWPEIIALLLVLVLYFTIKRSSKAQSFLEEVFSEFSKVTWSTRKEVVASTGVVVVMVALATIILSLFDLLWGSVMGKFLPIKAKPR